MGKSAEAASADPNAVRADKEHYIIPLPRLLALVKDVTLSEKDIERAKPDGALIEREADRLKFAKIALLIERCSDAREGTDRITMQRLAQDTRMIGAVLSQSPDKASIPQRSLNLVVDSNAFFIDAAEYFHDLKLPDRNNVRNLRDEKPQIFFSPDQIDSPLAGLDEDPKDLSRQIGSFHHELKGLMQDIGKIRPVVKIASMAGEPIFPVNNSYEL